MSEALKSSFVAFLMFGILAHSAAADPQHGKDIAKRWCSNCHVVEPGQTNAIDHAPPFSQIARTLEFDQNQLAFLLLSPHPNMPSLSLQRSEVSDLAEYIRSLK